MSNVERPDDSPRHAPHTAASAPGTDAPARVAPAFTAAELEALLAFDAEETDAAGAPAPDIHPETTEPAHNTAPPIEPSEPLPEPVTLLAPRHAPLAPTAPAPESGIALGDLLDREGGMEWRAAVAIIHRLCQHLKQHHSRGSVLLDPYNISVDSTGSVELLTSQASSDPLVRQVGHLLRTMLMGRHAPPELRLLVAQATFELPIFESVDDLERALVAVERHQNPSAADMARPVAAAATSAATAAAGRNANGPAAGAQAVPATPRSIRPARTPWRNQQSRFPTLRRWVALHGMRIAVGAIIVAALGALMWNPPTFIVGERRGPAVPQVAGGMTPAAGDPASGGIERESAAPTPRGRRDVPAVEPSPTRPRPGAPPRPERSPSTTALSAPIVVTPGAAPQTAPIDDEKRATAFVAHGNATQATMVFDSLLLGNPLYEPRPTDLTPEALAAFRASQRALLPVLAQRSYDRARAALAAGDPERALLHTREGLAILDRTSGDAGLRQMLAQLEDDAAAARAVADEVIYSAKDAGVVPPRALSRQFPATTPNGVPAHRVGTLEMVIARDGSVEFVKLHTPLNRYHERMIVSAAKAWQYRPATKGGRAVKYRLTVTINLPENGTY